MTILELQNVSLTFPGTGQPTLQEINYVVNSGDVIIVLGSNGSGKSSLFKLLHRTYHTNDGQINFLGKNIFHHDKKKFSQQVNILTQNISDSLFTSLTIYENYLLVKQSTTFKSKPKINERQFLANYLLSFNPNLSKKLDTGIQQLSGGEKQVFALALCFLQPPTLLLLDEHTSALDPKTSDQVMQLTQRFVAKYQITCLLTTHDLDIATRYGNRILVLREGKIYKTIDNKIKLSKEELAASCYN